MNLLITINSYFGAHHIQPLSLSLLMSQPQLLPAISALLRELSDQPSPWDMLPFSVWKEKPVNLLPGKTDIAELLLASRMQKTSISLQLIGAGNTCHFLSQLQLTCCISALITSSPTLTKSRFKRNSTTWYYVFTVLETRTYPRFYCQRNTAIVGGYTSLCLRWMWEQVGAYNKNSSLPLYLGVVLSLYFFVGGVEEQPFFYILAPSTGLQNPIGIRKMFTEQINKWFGRASLRAVSWSNLCKILNLELSWALWFSLEAGWGYEIGPKAGTFCIRVPNCSDLISSVLSWDSEGSVFIIMLLSSKWTVLYILRS